MADRAKDSTKRCPRCRSEGPFSRNKQAKDGLACYCKVCERARGKEYRRKNKTKIRDKGIRYRQENSTKIHTYGQRYQRANPEKARK